MDRDKEAHHKPQLVAVLVLAHEADIGMVGKLQPLKVVQRLADGLAFVLNVLVGVEELRGGPCLCSAVGRVDVDSSLDQFLACSRAKGSTTRTLCDGVSLDRVKHITRRTMTCREARKRKSSSLRAQVYS